MIKVRKINPSVKNAEQIRACDHQVGQSVQSKESAVPGWPRYISSTERFLENEMEGLKEEINQYHPLG